MTAAEPETAGAGLQFFDAVDVASRLPLSLVVVMRQTGRLTYEVARFDGRRWLRDDNVSPIYGRVLLFATLPPLPAPVSLR